jgi:hypothetical protein
VGLISTGGYFHWRYARLFPLEVISTGGAPGYFHWRSLFPLEVIISTGGHYFHWRSLFPLEVIISTGGAKNGQMGKK